MWLLKIVPTEVTCLNSDFKKDGFGSRQLWRKDELKVIDTDLSVCKVAD